MEIIAHRGYWKNPSEKNTLIAFSRSLNNGFGVEIDVRDYCGKIVVSHDVPDSKSLDFRKFLDLYSEYKDLHLAVNVKSCGLQNLLAGLFQEYKIKNYFIFDLPIPEIPIYEANGLNFFIRQSEHERDLSFYDAAKGVWLDEFHDHWITEKIIEDHIIGNKNICIVSPELHGRTFQIEWEEYKKMGLKNVMICTDYPSKARRFFDE